MNPPWTPAPTLDEAFQAVEAVARQHGYAPGRPLPLGSPANLSALDARCGAPVPDDLAAFLLWYDRRLWQHFVNSRAEGYDPENSRTVEIDLYGIDTLDELRRISPPNDYNLNTHIENLTHFGETARADAWKSADLLNFGSSAYGERLLYALSCPDFPRGCILTTTMDDPVVLWLADSLAQWLARLAACDGMEYAFVPGSIDDLAPAVRTAYTAEFHARNPKSSFFRA